MVFCIPVSAFKSFASKLYLSKAQWKHFAFEYSSQVTSLQKFKLQVHTIFPGRGGEVLNQIPQMNNYDGFVNIITGFENNVLSFL